MPVTMLRKAWGIANDIPVGQSILFDSSVLIDVSVLVGDFDLDKRCNNDLPSRFNQCKRTCLLQLILRFGGRPMDSGDTRDWQLNTQ